MSELEVWDGDGTPTGSLVRQPPGSGIDRHRRHGLDLTAEERRARKTNRRWLIGLAVTSVIILALALIASGVADSNQPTGPDIALPAGYQAVRDGYFTYAVPKDWPNNAEYSDNTGDIVNSGPTGWAGQHVGFRTSAPFLGEAPPQTLQAFGVPRPEPFQLGGGHPVTVKGASIAYSYTATRPGGPNAVVVDAYDARAAVEIWLVVSAPPDVTDRIVSSLAA